MIYLNPKQHKFLKLIKNISKILGYINLPINPPIAIGLLIFSEILNIFEESI